MIKHKRKKRQSVEHQAVYKVYPFIKEYIATSGVGPSLFEVAKHFKKSQEWVRYCYKVLVARKMIKVIRYKQRGVLLTK